ncbi:MAG: hypothetical protein RW306_04910 [Geobacteraceae bacterium]|nr:hypothetical protein [Geobacteraceae bacterium]
MLAGGCWGSTAKTYVLLAADSADTGISINADKTMIVIVIKIFLPVEQMAIFISDPVPSELSGDYTSGFTNHKLTKLICFHWGNPGGKQIIMALARQVLNVIYQPQPKEEILWAEQYLSAMTNRSSEPT